MSFLESLADAALKTTCVLALGLGAQLLFHAHPAIRRSLGVAAMGLALVLSVLAVAAPVQATIDVVAGPTRFSMTGSRPFDWAGLVVWVWAVGAMAVALMHGFGFAALYLVHRRSMRLPLSGASTDVRVTSDARITVPVAYGIFRPTILVPAASKDWTPEQAGAIMAHEASHLASRDPLALLLAFLLCSLHWFNPLAWVCLWRFRQDCEAVCDRAALATGIRPSTYAELLVRQSLRVGRGMPRQAVFPIVRESGLSHRVRDVLAADPLRTAKRLHLRVLVPVGIGLVLLLGSFRLSFGREAVFDQPGLKPRPSPPYLTDAERRAIEEWYIAAQKQNR